MTSRTVCFLGPDPEGVFDSLTAGLARSVVRVEGPAELVVIADTAYLAEAHASATQYVIVLDPGLADAAALRSTSGDVPVILSETVAENPAVLDSSDTVPAVVADATYVDLGAVTQAEVAESLFQQVRLLSALDPERTLDLHSTLASDGALSALGTWGDADVSLFAAHSVHEHPQVTATVHAPGRMARIEVPTSATLRPGEVSVESHEGQTVLPWIYSGAHRQLLKSLIGDTATISHEATLERFLEDAAALTSVLGRA